MKYYEATVMIAKPRASERLPSSLYSPFSISPSQTLTYLEIFYEKPENFHQKYILKSVYKLNRYG